MKKKILIVYTSYGSGHKTVAEYIYNYFNENSNDYEIKLFDIMDYGNKLAKLTIKIFNLNFKYQNSLFSTFTYELGNSKLVALFFKRITKMLFQSHLKNDILTYEPDIFIATHFYGSIIMGIINKKYHTKTKIITIITDYVSSAEWLFNHKNEDAIIVSNKIVKEEVIKYGVPENKIYPFGIPLSSKFKKTDKNINKIKYKYNIHNDNPIYLFFGGGSIGATYTYNYLKQILKLKLNINIIFVAGKNVKLQNKCNKLIKEENYKNITVLGFTNDVSNLLNIANCVITKPGGLSVTEALEMKTPLILIPGNGGQENHNARFVIKNGFGLRSYTSKHLARILKKINNNPTIIKNIYHNLKNYEENKSIEKLFNLIEKMEVKK